jgi:hypothetical protein
MRVATPTPVAPRRFRSTGHGAHGDQDAPRRALRPPVRPLDDATTEMVRVIEFVLPAGSAIQPVLWLERELLN